jgi:ABC-type multidrug transport system ATPase subunit
MFMTSATIDCHGLVKAYGGQLVLNHLDLTVRPGRVYALLGRNGAGKSTTFKIILGLVAPDAGTVSLLGQPWRRDLLRQVGASVDGPAVYPHLSAPENLLVHARLTGTPKRRIAETLDAAGIANTGRKKARTFSTGMRTRLALAIALLTDPPILMLDEPQNGLDPEGIIELRGLLRGLANGGRTVLISSHQLGEVTHLADDIGVVASGRMVYQGPLSHFAAGDLERAYLDATMVPAP